MKKRPPKILDYYILIYAPKHERAVGEGYVPEHILVAEKTLNRSLTADEEVRHINGNPQDNRPSNLEVISVNTGYKTHVLDSTDIPSRKSTKNFIPCRYQKPCWKTIRSKIARENNVYLPFYCSYQSEGDIYHCSRFWKFLEAEMEENKNKEKES